MKENKYDAGVVIVGFGYEFLIKAINSLISLRKSNPTLPVQLITNQLNFNPESISSFVKTFEEITFINAPNKDNRLYKINVITNSVFEKTLYIDADTEVHRSLEPGFKLLDYYDFLIRSNPIPHTGNYNFSLPVRPHDATLFNGGVWFFRKHENMQKFFQLWENLYIQLEGNYGQDQPSLASSIFALRDEINIYPLSLIYNFRDGLLSKNAYSSIKKHIIVNHYTDITFTLSKRLRKIHSLIVSYHDKGDFDFSEIKNFSKLLSLLFTLKTILILKKTIKKIIKR